VSPEQFDAMGVSVVVGGATPAELAAVARLFEELEDMFSRFRPGSELSLVNAAPAEFVAVTPTFSRILALALDSARRTGGLVDPTLGAAIEAAGYDDDFTELADGSAPRPAVPGSWRQVRVAGRIVLRRPGTKLDLNCVVKGLAVDAALSLLSGDGFVAAGGDVAVRGSAVVGLPGGGSLTLSNGGLATSGTTRRRWVRGGEFQHHLIDPSTGRPSTSRWSEVSVAAASCLEADVAAKAAFLLGDDGPAWLDERALPGRFLEDSETVVNDTWARSLAPARAA
jgi:thiamine biosynthesis lipoprotein